MTLARGHYASVLQTATNYHNWRADLMKAQVSPPGVRGSDLRRCLPGRVGCGALVLPMSAFAQADALVPAVKAVNPLVVDGETIQETSFKLSSLKCKVVMVMMF